MERGRRQGGLQGLPRPWHRSGAVEATRARRVPSERELNFFWQMGRGLSLFVTHEALCSVAGPSLPFFFFPNNGMFHRGDTPGPGQAQPSAERVSVFSREGRIEHKGLEPLCAFVLAPQYSKRERFRRTLRSFPPLPRPLGVFAATVLLLPSALTRTHNWNSLHR